MEQPAVIDLHGDRNVAFDDVMAFFGIDLSGCTPRMQIRAAPDAPGAALVDLAVAAYPTQGLRIVYAGVDTVAAHIAANRFSRDEMPPAYANYSDGENLALTMIGIHLSKTTMAFASAPAQENGDSVALAYDLLITPSGGIEDKYAYGNFIIRGTVTV